MWLEQIVELAESMLEKEKEVMESAWQDGMYECDGDGTFEDFYKTFKHQRCQVNCTRCLTPLTPKRNDVFRNHRQ